MKFFSSLGSMRRRRSRKEKVLNVGLTQKSRWRRESSPRTLTRLISIAAAFLIGVILIFTTLRQAMAFLTGNPRYAIAQVQIAEPMYMSVTEIEALAAVPKGENLLHLSLSKTRKKLLEHPNIQDAVLQKVLPDILRIQVKEREPLAQINIGKNYLVDKSGSVLSWNDKFAQRTWPQIEGLSLKSKVVNNQIQSEALADVLRILNLLGESVVMTRMNVSQIRLDDPAGYVFAMDKDPELILGPGMTELEIREKLAQLAAVLEDLGKKGMTAQAIDLRFKDVIVTPRNTSASKAQSIGKAITGRQGKK